jgi:salicylate 5-hydroxylase large subunit
MVEANAIGANPTSPWAADRLSRIPAKICSKPDISARELERIFYGRHWGYVGLEVEVEEAAAFKRSSLGERSLIMIRNRRGDINVREHHCVHRAMQFCKKRSGNES